MRAGAWSVKGLFVKSVPIPWIKMVSSMWLFYLSSNVNYIKIQGHAKIVLAHLMKVVFQIILANILV